MKLSLLVLLIQGLCFFTVPATAGEIVDTAMSWSGVVNTVVPIPGAGTLGVGAAAAYECYMAGGCPQPPVADKNAAEEPGDPKPSTQKQPQSQNQQNAQDEARRRAEQAVASCEGATSSMTNSCSSSRAEQAASSLNTDVSSGADTACGQSSGASNSASSGVSQVRSECETAYRSCTSACSSIPNLDAYSDLKSRASQARASCQTGSSRLQAIDGVIGGMNHVQNTSDKCREDATNQTAGNMAPPPTSDEARDCSNPEYAAGNGVCGGVTTPPVSSASTNTQQNATQEDTFSQIRDGGSATGENSYAGGNDSVSDSTGGFGNSEIRPAGGAPMDTDGGLGTANSANKPDGKAPGVKVASISPNILGGRTGASGSSMRHESGKYNKNGSWIPPKIGEEKNQKADMPNMDRFRPVFNMVRGPANVAAHALGLGILGPTVDIWSHMNNKYLAVMPTLEP